MARAFTVGIWEKIKVQSRLRYLGQTNTGFTPDDLLQEVFQWDCPVPLAEGCLDPEVSAELSERLIRQFHPSQTAKQVETFKEELESLRTLVEKQEVVWTAFGDQHLAPLVSIYLSLSWLSDTFRNAPEATVAVR